LILVAGCAVGPDYHRSSVRLSQEFGELHTTAGTNADKATNLPPVAEWWRGFNDPTLERLIHDALRQNYDIRIAVERIRESRFQRSIIAADLFPEVNTGAGYLRSRGSKNVELPLGAGGSGGSSGAGVKKQTASRDNSPASGSAGASAAQSAAGAPLTPFGQGGLPGVTSSLYQIGFDASWEIDMFGGNRRRLEAAAADLGASVEQLHQVTLTMLAELARDYFELRGTQVRLAIAHENLAAAKDILELTQSRAKSGLTDYSDVTRAAAQVAAFNAVIPPFESIERRSVHAISILLAREPTELAPELEKPAALPPVPLVVPVGLPSDLLQRRPDIRRAERQIAAATASVGSAKAELFPKFALTASAGLDSSSPGNLFNWESRYFLISPNVTWRIFDAGRIVSNLALQKANRRESELQYRSTILTAFREVEDALVAYATEQSRRISLAEEMTQDKDSVALVRQRYEHGLVNFIEVLDALERFFSVRDQLAQSDQATVTELVALYKALGGGWPDTVSSGKVFVDAEP
jgi:NodT family efflux transporter outer membrane factor (OMF) lipoprotein